MAARVLLLLPTTSYKAGAFLEAAGRLGVAVVVGTDHRQTLAERAPGATLALGFDPPERALETIMRAHEQEPFAAVVGTDDETTLLAALAGLTLGLRHNPPEAARAARDKLESRRCFQAAGMRCPEFRRVALTQAPEDLAREFRYPSVLKPLRMAAGRGVLRADDPESFAAAFRRVRAIVRCSRSPDDALLVEDYVPGAEVALEGLLDGGRLDVLALFDKPDPLVGPVFEETIYVTPSRLAPDVRSAIAAEAAAACRALGLVEGPIHAELRVRDGQPWILEVAPRTIGGLCSRALRFGAGVSLEELILRHALGRDDAGRRREDRAAGVMMIPIPRAGVLRGVAGLAAARALPLVEEVVISSHRGATLVPLPEGHRYLGFIFARGDDPASVERALREAHARLHFTID